MPDTDWPGTPVQEWPGTPVKKRAAPSPARAGAVPVPSEHAPGTAPVPHNAADMVSGWLGTTPVHEQPIRMGLAGTGRGSEEQEPPPEPMQVGPLKHTYSRAGTKTTSKKQIQTGEGRLSRIIRGNFAPPESMGEIFTTPLGLGSEFAQTVTPQGNDPLSAAGRAALGFATPASMLTAGGAMGAGAAAPALGRLISAGFSVQQAKQAVDLLQEGHPWDAVIAAVLGGAAGLHAASGLKRYRLPQPEGIPDALQQRPTAEVLQREPGDIGETGSERGRMEPGLEGTVPAGTRGQIAEEAAGPQAQAAGPRGPQPADAGLTGQTMSRAKARALENSPIVAQHPDGWELRDEGNGQMSVWGPTGSRVSVGSAKAMKGVFARKSGVRAADSAPPVVQRTDTGYVNSKTWYHGTPAPDLTADQLDPFFGNHESLMGHGVYLTESPEIARGYAGARGNKRGDSNVYAARVNVNKVLDLETQAPPEVRALMEREAKNLGESGYNDHLTEALAKPGSTSEELIHALRSDIGDYSHGEMVPTSEFVEVFQDLNVNLRRAGYDALTHTGGKRTGKSPHQVLILLDPHDNYSQVGRAGQITDFAPHTQETPAEPSTPSSPGTLQSSVIPGVGGGALVPPGQGGGLPAPNTVYPMRLPPRSPGGPPIQPPVGLLPAPPDIPHFDVQPRPVKAAGRYKQVYRFDKDLGDQTHAIAESRARSLAAGELAQRYVTKGLDSQQKQKLGEYLVGKRLWDEQQAGGTAIGTAHPQTLTPAQQAAILSDPKIAEAVERHVETQSEIEGHRLRAGLSPEAAMSKSREFVSLVRPPVEEGAGPPKPGGSVASRFRAKKTGFAKRATLSAPEYSTDLAHIYSQSFGDILPKTAVNDLYELARARGLASENAQPGWKPVEHLVGKRVFMPAQMADALQDAVLKQPMLEQPWMVRAAKAYGKGAVTLGLTGNPIEALGHMRRQASLLRGIPSTNRSYFQRVLESSPIVGDAITVGKLWRMDADHPEMIRLMRDIFDSGAGSKRAFDSYRSETVKRIPILNKWQESVHETLFGLPKGRGVGGWDMRVKMAAELIRRNAEGNADPQRTREFLSQFNQYMDRPDLYVEALRSLNPYAATQVPTRLFGIRQSVGMSGLKAQSTPQAVSLAVQTIARRVGGVALTGIALNKALSGHYPWENDPGHRHQIELGTDSTGSPVYMDWRGIDPVTGQVMNSFGISEMSREEKFEETDKQGNPIRKGPPEINLLGPLNAALQTVSSPAANATLETLTGMVPYVRHYPGQGYKPVNIAPKSDLAGRALEAAKNVNPIGGWFQSEEGEQSGKPSGPGWGLLNWLTSQSVKKERQ